MNSLSIIIPTYNEEENIGRIILTLQKILQNNSIPYEILVMDDNSTDNTQIIVKDISSSSPNIRLIVRFKDHGLSQSVVDGFSRAQYDLLIVMDADFSHPPPAVIELYNALDGNDLAIGSRYIKGGAIENWPVERKILSFGATFLARLLFPDICDPVSGFFGFHRRILNVARLKPRGYKILLEILGKNNWNSIIELPIKFIEREGGSSKLNFKVIFQYIIQFTDIVVFRACHRIHE
ncbi:polyprenol monophosphomannose synthase [uncultured Methanospirillum sp.]|uniref:polyprenol monophosphomannose synthase n=1 Tax=uncultured Methanospirillum sp. TaxID=262503 RepID=UPI0029C77CEF|nr:polyprenol monophosphomannose synthase [uncultured Methanospirillum sp.]